MGAAASEKCLRITCYILQLVCFITGAAMLGLGVWAVVDRYLTKLIGEVMMAGMIILIIAGAIMILLVIMGCLAIKKESKPLVVIYCIIALFAIFLKVVGCIIIFDYFVTSHFELRESYKFEYGNSTHHANVKEIWDRMQKEGECCGLLQYQDWEESQYYKEHDNTYPESCCILDEDGAPKNLEHCVIGRQETIHAEGCEWVLERYYYGIGGTAVAIIIIELFAVVMIACLYQYYP